MNKRKIAIMIIGIACIFAVIIVLIEKGGSNPEQDNSLFSGNGRLKQAKRLNGLGAIYNDDYIFFQSWEQVYYKLKIADLESENRRRITVNCRDASCLHEGESCEAYVDIGEFFVFNNKLYKLYNDQRIESVERKRHGHIVDMESGKEVFKNTVPEDMPEEQAVDDDEMINYVRVLNDDLLKVDGRRHAYLLDKDFKIRYCHYNIGKYPWGAVFNGCYYYVDDAYQLVKIDLNTSESTVIDIPGKAFMADSDEDNIYFSNEFGELHKLAPNGGKAEKLADDSLFFSVQDKYIYAWGGEGSKKIIYDKDGKQVADYTECINMEADAAFQIGDRIYTCMHDGIAYMDEDGKNYGEISKWDTK